MRIIAGKIRGRKLHYKQVGLRPSKGRVREALFNILQQDIEGAVFLDLCCGTGAMGLEAYSRGAKHVVFVDTDTRLVSQNGEGLNEGIRILRRSYEEAFNEIQSSDIVFFDPPWELQESYKQVFDVWLKAKRSQILICEHPQSQALDFKSRVHQKHYTYGLTQLMVFRKN